MALRTHILRLLGPKTYYSSFWAILSLRDKECSGVYVGGRWVGLLSEGLPSNWTTLMS